MHVMPILGQNKDLDQVDAADITCAKRRQTAHISRASYCQVKRKKIGQKAKK